MAGPSLPKSWDWVFHALWSAAGDSLPDCQLNVPDTILFDRDGGVAAGGSVEGSAAPHGARPKLRLVPSKWLRTSDTGHLVRASFVRQQGALMSAPSRKRNHAGAGAGGTGMKRDAFVKAAFSTIEAAFVQFQRQFRRAGRGAASPSPAADGMAGSAGGEAGDDPPFCRVWYATSDFGADFEDLDQHGFQALSRGTQWQQHEIIAIQAYVPWASAHHGVFDVSDRPRSLIQDDTQAVFNVQTTAVAQFAERAYMRVPEGGSAAHANGTLLHGVPASEAKLITQVTNMEGHFIRDITGRVWFSHAEKVETRALGSHRERAKHVRRELEARNNTAAVSVAEELRKVLRVANSHAVPPQAAFDWFDTQGVGYVDKLALMEALSRMGIGVTPGVSEVVVSMIGQSSSQHFNAQDLAAFSGIIEEKPPENIAPPESSSASPRFSPSTSTASSGMRLGLSQRGAMRAATQHRPGSAGAIRPRSATARARVDGVSERTPSTTTAAAPAELNQQLHPRQRTQPASQPPLQQQQQQLGTHQPQPRQEQKQQPQQQPPALKLPWTQLTVVGAEDDDALADTKDSVLHVDRGVVMTYRVLRGRERPPPPALQTAVDRFRDGREEHEKKQEEVHARGPVDPHFTVIAIPDVFMTLDVLEEWLEPLVSTHPEMHAILVGLPGLPNTCWPPAWPVNTHLHARCVDRVLRHLQTEGHWTLHPDEFIVFAAFGNGASVFSRFTQVLTTDEYYTKTQPSTAGGLPFLRRVRSAIVANGFATKILKARVEQLDDDGACVSGRDKRKELLPRNSSRVLSRSDSKVSRSKGAGAGKNLLGRILSDLVDVMNTATVHEVSETVLQLHFGDRYVARNGRDEVLREFWRQRAGMSTIARGDSDGYTGDGSSFVGVHAQLRGILQDDERDASEAARTIADAPFPLMVVTSSADKFVHPRYSEQFNSQTALREVMETPEDAITRTLEGDNAVYCPRAICTQTLDAGHEVLQERPSFMRALVGRIVASVHNMTVSKFRLQRKQSMGGASSVLREQVTGIVEEPDDGIPDHRPNAEALEEQAALEAAEAAASEAAESLNGFASPRSASHANSADAASPTSTDENAFLTDDEGDDGQQKIYEENGAQGKEGGGGESGDDADGPSRPMTHEEKLRRRGKRQKEAELRRKRLEEQRIKKEVAKREEEMEALRQAEAAKYARKREEQERFEMYREDRRSKLVEFQTREDARWNKNRDAGLQRTLNLQETRMEEERKKVEWELAKKRAEKHEERRKTMEAALERVAEQERAFVGDSDAYAIVADPFDVRQAVGATQRLLADLLLLWEQNVDALKRARELEKKVELFRKQYYAVDFDCRKVRRAIRVLEKKNRLSEVGGSSASMREVQRMHEKLHAKETVLSDYRSILNGRQAMLDAANRACQRLKELRLARENTVADNLNSFRVAERALQDRYQDLRLRKDQMSHRVGKLQMDKHVYEKRLKEKQKELVAARQHKGKTIDTVVWQSGYMQRMLTRDLKKKLMKDIETGTKQLSDVQAEIDGMRDDLLTMVTIAERYRRDAERANTARREFARTWMRYQRRDLKAEVAAALRSETNAETVQTQRDKEVAELQQAENQGAETLADRVRFKDSESRSREEKHWVAIDVMINPGAYSHVTDVEADEMKYDPEYKVELSDEDAKRLVRLPEQIQLAMPFLFSPDEIYAHRLMSKYSHGMGEEYFQRGDWLSQDDETFQTQMPIPGQFEPRVHQVQSGVAASGSISSAGSGSMPGPVTNLLEEADEVHKLLVKQCKVTRARSTPPEDLTEAQAKWLSVDRVLHPHVFSAPEVEDAAVEAAMTAARTASAHQADKNAKNLEDLKATDAGEGNGSDAQSTVTLSSGTQDAREQWQCPFNRGQLEILADTPMEELQTDEQRDVKRLLDDFYVSPNQSLEGKVRLQTIARISGVLDFDDEAAALLNGNDEGESAGCGDGDGEKNAPEAEAKDQVQGQEPHQDQEGGPEDGNASEGFRSVKGQVRRIWGSWEEVSPASAGAQSQEQLFSVYVYDPLLVHPGSFAIHQEEQTSMFDGEGKDGVRKGSSLGEELGLGFLDDADIPRMGLQALLDLPGPSAVSAMDDSPFLVCKSLEALARLEARAARQKTVLIRDEHTSTLFEEKDLQLESRQSRAHQFFIKPQADGSHVLDLTVTVVFQGVFGARGYRLGRMACQLFRLPQVGDAKQGGKPPAPQPLGFAPYKLQQLNTGESLGRIMILHRPRRMPVKHGQFQVVVGAAAPCKYSVHVTCTWARQVDKVLDEKMKDALAKQERYPLCVQEILDLDESVRLAERKTAVVDIMMEEAEAETRRCEGEIKQLHEILERDERMVTMNDDDRRDALQDLNTLEVEFAHWCKVYASRVRERNDIKDGVELMRKLRIGRVAERDSLKSTLNQLRRDVPTCVAIVRTYKAAAEAAVALNTAVRGTSSTNKFTSVQVVQSSVSTVMTPAEEVRRRHQVQGWETLSIPEQQWVMLDRELNADKYEWEALRERESKVAAGELEDDGADDDAPGDRTNSIPRPDADRPVLAPAVEKFRYSKEDLARILSQPFQMLTRREMQVRKLLARFHDTPKLMQRSHLHSVSGFDPHLAERVRAKSENTRTKEERMWATIDIRLNPEVWASYTRKDESTAYFDHEKREAEGLERERETGIRREWICPFNREQVMEIWSKRRNNLRTNDERLVHRLLHKYNGAYDQYVEATEIAEKRRERMVQTQGRDWTGIRFDLHGRVLEQDPDKRCRELLQELDRAVTNSNELMDTTVLTGNYQRFPTEVLRLELERDLDRQLREQVLERERAQRFNVDGDGESSEEELSDSDDSDDDNEAKEQRKRQRAEKRLNKRTNLKASRLKEEVNEARKKAKLGKKEEEDLEMAKLMEELGVGGCLACRTNPCQWQRCADDDSLRARRTALFDEITRVRRNAKQLVFESNVPVSAQRGGGNKFARDDLMRELQWESREVETRLRLSLVDDELHRAFSTRKEYMEVKSLHGYATMIWVDNARKALNFEHNRLVAATTATEIVEDILDWMLEGWHFGERESNYTIAGFVPSLKQNGNVRMGSEQRDLAPRAVEKEMERERKRKAGEELPDEVRGTLVEKANPVELQSQWRIRDELAVKKGSDRDHMLDETEQSLKYGLFCLTFMYFRAMAMLKRDQESFGGEATLSELQETKSKASEERRRMFDEVHKAEVRQKKIKAALDRAAVGEAREKHRIAQEKRDEARKLVRTRRLQEAEQNAVVTIQRLYRGHLGRKAARRWLLKKAELDAMNALMTAAAITVQRVYRGHRGRVRSRQLRADLAEFIASLRQEEAEFDEEEYWRTHPWTRFKRDWKESRNKEKVHQKALSLSALDELEQIRKEEEEEKAAIAALMAEREGFEDDSDDEDDDEGDGSGDSDGQDLASSGDEDADSGEESSSEEGDA